MCHVPGSVPAIPPIAGAAVDSEDVVLTSKDGTKFQAFTARAEKPSGAGMVVMPDIRGLHHFYEELALRFAEEGINSIAMDYFGRTAGVGKRADEFPWMEHIPQTKAEGISDDVAASVAYLKSPAGGSCTSVFTVGFCFGGSASWLQVANGHGLSGAIGFYGGPTRPGRDGSPSVVQRVPEFTAPILGLMGGADQGITAENIDEYRAALKAAGKQGEIITYPGAPHSFFDRSFVENAEASADAWKRCLAFVRSNAK